MEIDQGKLEQFIGRALGDFGASMSAMLVHIGDKLGLYKAMAGAGPMTPAELARKTGTAERYLREWLNNQAAGGYVEYDAKTQKYTLPPEQAYCLAQEDSPMFLAGGYEVMAGVFASEPRLTAAFKSGQGVGWGEHDHRLFSGTERFFRPGYNANLTSAWIPSLDGVQARLEAGAQVADVGCGHGASTIVMARAYPKSTFVGFDFHAPSVERARQVAKTAGLADRVRFEVASAKSFTGRFDLIAFFDCLHDMGDPVGALRHTREQLAPGGTLMMVEPFAGDKVEENLNPIGRVYYGASTMVCTPASLAQEVGLALGAQAGEARWRGLFIEAGFAHFRRATETPFNLIFEARA